MRDLTFRAWVDGRMVAVRRLEWAGAGELIVNGEHWISPERVMQGTGVADCTGREVFEGDIVIDHLAETTRPQPWLIEWGLHHPLGAVQRLPDRSLRPVQPL